MPECFLQMFIAELEWQEACLHGTEMVLLGRLTATSGLEESRCLFLDAAMLQDSVACLEALKLVVRIPGDTKLRVFPFPLARANRLLHDMEVFNVPSAADSLAVLEQPDVMPFVDLSLVQAFRPWNYIYGKPNIRLLLTLIEAVVLSIHDHPGIQLVRPGVCLFYSLLISLIVFCM